MHKRNIKALAFNPSGDKLVSSVIEFKGGGKLFFWNLSKLHEKTAYQTRNFNENIHRVYWPQEQHVVTTSPEDGVSFWNTQSLKKESLWSVEQCKAYYAALNADGKKMVTAAGDRYQLSIWDLYLD